jgi:hypothetical protein
MKILTDWIYTKEGLRYRQVEYTEKEEAQFISLMDFLQESRRDFSENTDLCRNNLGK